MDKKRRNKLNDIIGTLSSLSDCVESLCDEEQDCMDNYPENLQGTDRFSAMENAVDYLSRAVDAIDEARDCIEEAIG